MPTFRRGLIVLLAGALALFLVPGLVYANTWVKNCADCHFGVELTGKDIEITGFNDGTDSVRAVFGFHILDTEGNEVAREASEVFLFDFNTEVTMPITVNDYGLADGEWKYIGWVMPITMFRPMEANMEDNQASVLLYKGLISDNDKPDTLEISKSYTGDWFVNDEFGHFGGPEKTSLFSSNGAVEHKFLMKSGWAKVYIWYLESPDNGTEIPVTIMRNDMKLDKVYVNQQKNGSKMNFLGEYPFHAEDIAKVIIEADGKDNFVSSDVVFLEYTGSLDSESDGGGGDGGGCFMDILRY